MDPLSVAANAIAVATLAASICSAISDLRALCKSLPGRIHAVNNEVADLELVLSQISLLLDERHALLDSNQPAISHLLAQARTKLYELQTIVHRLTAASKNSRIPLTGASAWRKEQAGLKNLQDDIRAVKSSLNIMLGASNSRDMMKVRLGIEEVTAISTRMSQNNIVLSRKAIATLAGVDERIARVESLLQAQTLQLQAQQFSQVGLSYSRAASSRNMLIPQRQRPAAAGGARDGTGARIRPYVMSCNIGCSCACHSQKRYSTSETLRSILGHLFIGYAGFPMLSPKCDVRSCQDYRTSRFTMEYWFPLSISSMIIQARVEYLPNFGPSLQLDTLRRVPDSAQCIDFALNGNIAGLQYLFKRGLASPRDVSTSRGYSLLRWALYAKQYKTCEFLIHEGADPDYRPIAASDNSPRIKACHFLLEGGLSEAGITALRTITNGSDHLDEFIDASKFTKHHKIVLGLSMLDLEEEIITRPSEIDAQDTMGRTPLAWAAARGDSRSVAMLLSYGADPNIADIQISGPLSNAASQGRTACVELLLEAGADPDPPQARGIKKGNPLSVAARNCRNPMIGKRLLDFGADVNQTNMEGKTPLFHATRNDNASFVILLLEYGADINATSTNGETPLTTAITYNSHNVLRLFLERWHEYTVCPRLKGSHLLEIAALYGDSETLSILAATDHFRSKYDRQYTLKDFRAILGTRPDISDRLLSAFDELLDVINMGPDPRRGEEFFLESGFLSCFPSHANNLNDGFVREVSSDEDSVDSFYDAPSIPMHKTELGHAEYPLA